MPDRLDISARITADSSQLDCLLAFAIALERRGLLTRAEIAATLRTVKAQVEALEGAPSRRSAVAAWLLPTFEAPIAGADARTRLRVIAGADDDPPPRAA